MLKRKDPEINGVRDALLRHMILFNLFLADLLQISNNFFKFLQSRTIQFSSLPGKVYRMKKHFKNTRKILKQRDPFFSTMQTIIYTLLTNYQSYLVRLEKKDYKSSQWKNESKTLQKIAHPFPKDFLAEIDVAFKKSYGILCAFEVLNVDNLNKQQSNLVNLFETSIRVLANFYGTEIEG